MQAETSKWEEQKKRGKKALKQDTKEVGREKIKGNRRQKGVGMKESSSAGT